MGHGPLLVEDEQTKLKTSPCAVPGHLHSLRLTIRGTYSAGRCHGQACYGWKTDAKTMLVATRQQRGRMLTQVAAGKTRRLSDLRI